MWVGFFDPILKQKHKNVIKMFLYISDSWTDNIANFSLKDKGSKFIWNGIYL